MIKDFKTIDLGLVDYNKAFLFQEELVQKRQKDEIKDSIVFCKHPSVVTLGRSSEETDLMGWTGDVVKVNRGGRATYHGPKQFVVYPILKIKDNKNLSIRSQDVRQYLEFLEGVLIRMLGDLGVEASVESGEPLKPGQLNRGVWVRGKKIASIGIAVKKWVTMHGLALNVGVDELAFDGIKACGFEKTVYTSLEELGVATSYADCLKLFVQNIKK